MENAPGTKILIVEDDTISATILDRMLQEAGYQVVGIAKTGVEAIEMSSSLESDIITLDMVLPDMNGFDVLAKMKQNGVTSKIIVVSAAHGNSVVNEALQKGADGYVMKPVTRDAIAKEIAMVMW